VLRDAIAHLEREYPESTEIRELVHFLLASERGRQGRQFESRDRKLR
jgi:hypothetical protein